MNLDGHCPGCGGGEGNQSCKIAGCSIEHSRVDDIFITHRNWEKDFCRMKELCVTAYISEQNQKVELLKYLLENYNDGRRKSFYCLAVNLLDLEDLKRVMALVA